MLIYIDESQRLNINFLTARSFYYLCYPLIGVKLEVEGREHLDKLMTIGENGKAQSAVLVGNHQRWVVLSVRRCSKRMLG